MTSEVWKLLCLCSLVFGLQSHTTIPSFTHECWGFVLRSLCLQSKSLTDWATSLAPWQSFECVDMVFFILWNFWCFQNIHWFPFFISCNYYWRSLFVFFSFSVWFEVCKYYWFFKTVGFVFTDFSLLNSVFHCLFPSDEYMIVTFIWNSFMFNWLLFLCEHVINSLGYYIIIVGYFLNLPYCGVNSFRIENIISLVDTV